MYTENMRLNKINSLLTITLFSLSACGGNVSDDGLQIVTPSSSSYLVSSYNSGSGSIGIGVANPWTCKETVECINIIQRDLEGTDQKMPQLEANNIFRAEAADLYQIAIKYNDLDLDIEDYRSTIATIDEIAAQILDDQSLAIERARNYRYLSHLLSNFPDNYENIEYKLKDNNYSPPVIVMSKVRLAVSLGESNMVTQFDLVKSKDEWKIDLVDTFNPSSANPRIILFSLNNEVLEKNWQEIETLQQIIANPGVVFSKFKKWWNESSLEEKQEFYMSAGLDNELSANDIYEIYPEFFVNQIPDELSGIVGMHYSVSNKNKFIVDVEYLVINEDDKWILDIKENASGTAASNAKSNIYR